MKGLSRLLSACSHCSSSLASRHAASSSVVAPKLHSVAKRWVSREQQEEARKEMDRLTEELLDELYEEQAYKLEDGIKVAMPPWMKEKTGIEEPSKPIRDVYDTYRVSEKIRERLRNRDAYIGNCDEESLKINIKVQSPLPFDLGSLFESFQILALIRHCALYGIFDNIPATERISLVDLGMAAQCNPGVLYRVFRALSLVNYTSLEYEMSNQGNLQLDYSRIFVSHTEESKQYSPKHLGKNYDIMVEYTDQIFGVAWSQQSHGSSDSNMAPYADLTRCFESGKSALSSSKRTRRWLRTQVASEASQCGPKLCVEVVSFLDLRGRDNIMEVAGTRGRILQTVLSNIGDVQGFLYGTESWIDMARQHWKSLSDRMDSIGSDPLMEDVISRVQFVAGDELGHSLRQDFDDAYMDCIVLRGRLRRLNDEHCLTLIDNLKHRLSENPKASIVVIEQLMPESMPNVGVNQSLNLRDIDALVQFGSKERTLSEFDNLFTQCGLFRDPKRRLKNVGQWHVLEYTPQRSLGSITAKDTPLLD